MNECRTCTGCVNISFALTGDVKTVILSNNSGEVRLNFENFAQLIGLFIILDKAKAQSVFTKNLKLIYKSDDQIIVIRKTDEKRFSIILEKQDFLNIISSLPEIFKKFSLDLSKELISSKQNEKD